MAIRSREEYEARRARRAAHEERGTRGVSIPVEPAAALRPVAHPDPADIELRMGPIYGALVLFAGLTFCVLAVLAQNRGGRNFRIFCAVTGLGALAGGIALLRNRPVVVRMTAGELVLRGTTIPWTEIEDVRRARSSRSYWIGIYLKTRRTDFDEISRRARAMLAAQKAALADADYVILEADLPRSGLWFLDECHRRMKR